MNNKNGGKAHLMLSAPPTLKPREIRIPKNSFFSEVFNPWKLKDTFHAFHKIMKTDYKNINIREGRDYRIQEYIDHIVRLMWQLRIFLENYEGEFPSSLNGAQKYWLYPDYKIKRDTDDEWLDLICSQVSKSFISSYEKVLGKNGAIKLGDDGFKVVANIVDRNKEVLR